MHTTLRQMRVFQVVAEQLNYTKAARVLHLSQPAVSMQVKQLEDAVGLPLFEPGHSAVAEEACQRLPTG